jgi:hypothetical protein
MLRRYEISDKRHRKLFDQRPGEDAHIMIARQICMSRPHEITTLYMLRSEPKQARAMQLAQAARAAYWSRWAVLAVVLSIPANVAIVLLSR